MKPVAVAPWILLAGGVALGLVQADVRIDLVRRGYRCEALRRVRDALREEERVLRIGLAGEQRAAEDRSRVGTRAAGGTSGTRA